MRIVTAGYRYLDIDAYAGCIAYAELLNLKGIAAKAATSAPLNESITKTVRSWYVPLDTGYTNTPGDTFTLIDISEAEYFDTFVDVDRVDEVIDHHPGFEAYWHERIGKNARIEFIGAACTLVYESWEAAGLSDKISQTSARLLVCGILDNTLNFGANVTTERDKKAYASLITKASLPDSWPAHYFMECQEALLKDPNSAIKSDSKIITFHTYKRPMCVGQAVVWEGEKSLSTYQPTMKKILSGLKPDWCMNLISISERKSYFVTDNKDTQEWLATTLGVHFNGTVAAADRLWLRKEIIKTDQQKRPSR